MKNTKLIRLNKIIANSLFFIAVSIPGQALATIELTEDLRLSGFGSTSITKSDNKTPLFTNRRITDETCYDCDTIFGLQLDYDFLESFTTSVQVVKRPQDDFSSPELEWAYVGYETESFDFKVGKLRLPLFLHSEYYFVAQAYTESRPNQEVYDSIFGITSFIGANFTWNTALGDELMLNVTPYYGGNYSQEVTIGLTGYKFDINDLYGASIDLSGDNYRIHFNALHAGFDMTVQLANLPIPFISEGEDANIYSLGAEYDFSETIFIAEVYKRDDILNWYTGVKYRMSAFTPYINYGKSSGKASNYNHSITTGVRYDVTNSISVNLEYQQVNMDKEVSLPSLTSSTGGPLGQFEENPLFYGTKVDAEVATFMINFIF
jgi:opacity protein-like surface antigen